MAISKKDPDAVLDYGVDWTAWLGGDTITTSTWFVGPAAEGDVAPLTVAGNPAPTHDTRTTKVWLRGGTAGRTYAVTNRITTAGGRTDDRTLRLPVEQR